MASTLNQPDSSERTRRVNNAVMHETVKVSIKWKEERGGSNLILYKGVEGSSRAEHEFFKNKG